MPSTFVYRTISAMLSRTTRNWAELSLVARFMVLTIVGTVGVMLIVGHWVAERIAQGVVRTSANASANYAGAFIGPSVQELADRPVLSEDSRLELDKLLKPQIARNQIWSVRIWNGNTIVYSDDKQLIGTTFPPDEDHRRAAGGTVTANFQRAHYTTHAPPGLVGHPVLELHAPIHQIGTNRVLGIVEVYELAPELAEELWWARFGTWLIVGAATAVLIALQLMIVLAGSRTIDRQRISLEEQIGRLRSLLIENADLRTRMSQANGRVATMNDHFLRRIGADLHDGPVQYLGVAMLRLDSLSATVDAEGEFDADDAREDLGVVRETMREAVSELRHISAGLSLPEIDRMSPAAVIESVADRHERRTCTIVARHLQELPGELPAEVKSCIYRLTQEGLTNAFRHADGNGQEIEAIVDREFVEIRVLDRGPIRQSAVYGNDQWQQGLIGLRDRVEALGAKFEMSARQGGGTCLTGRFPISSGESRELTHVSHA